MRESIEVSAILVTYNSRPVLDGCLRSLQAQEGIGLEILVVDNASKDGTGDWLAERFPEIRLWRNRENVGFGRACNQGMREARGEVLLFVNPDLRFPEPDAVAQLAGALRADPSLGAVGPTLYGEDGLRQPSTARGYPNERWTRGELGSLPGELAALLGACLALPAETAKAVGGFDEDFFLYGEDQDLCLRLRRKGLRLACLSEVRARHIGRHSEEGTSPREYWRKKLQGEYLFYRKHYAAHSLRRIRIRQWVKSSWELLLLALCWPIAGRASGWKERWGKYAAIREAAEGREGNNGKAEIAPVRHSEAALLGADRE
ncbi:glycosyltransferase family 2 protein [Methylacidimicrobium sp. B4]|uniref:glycosyltransferase family 2 protein n=1 Tax=Methylacidimicrobium sp. B4 TaxID=2796139 RepID=UPI001A8DE098|nr:glycosyltransferase family 2 protein [Methylacidimicrobium sp. B4]QSR85050.1 glycosyltransferase family 2 protein [Methylacidimicrobium sp. B4]